MEPALEIKMVRENLALAVCLWAAAKKGLITPLHLPAGRVVLTEDWFAWERCCLTTQIHPDGTAGEEKVVPGREF